MRKKPKNKQIILFFGAIIILAASIVIVLQATKQAEKPQAEEAEAVVIDPQKLAGRWLRPDGGYVLELSEIGDDGSLEAAYFNPKPINVAAAGWRWSDNHLQVYVEFDDVNYRGSNYSLVYLESEDLLVGNYYQATLQQNFKIQFIRQDN